MFGFLVYPFFLILTLVCLCIVIYSLKRAKNIPQKICGWLSLIITLGYPILLFGNPFFYSIYGFVIPFSIETFLVWFLSPMGFWFLVLLIDIFYEKKGKNLIKNHNLKKLGASYADGWSGLFMLAVMIYILIIITILSRS